MSKAITLSKASIYRRKAATCRDLAVCAKSTMDREHGSLAGNVGRIEE
jgi:hypothetical protein